jgi:hypothetical protein
MTAKDFSMVDWHCACKVVSVKPVAALSRLVANVANPSTEFCRSKKSYSADVLAMKATPTFNGGCCKKLCRVAYRYLTDAVQAEYLLICATCGRNDNANNKSIHFATSEDSFN